MDVCETLETAIRHRNWLREADLAEFERQNENPAAWRERKDGGVSWPVQREQLEEDRASGSLRGNYDT